jgi:eukaryotic-like serine/threonine-protein kinase
MKIEELDNMPEVDDIVIQVEQFKMALISRATGNGGLEGTEYVKSRKLVLGIPRIENVLPKFLKLCRTVDEFWAWIKDESSTYAERRVIISEAMNPILEIIEYENGDGTLEFKKAYDERQIIGNGGFGLVYLYEHKLLKMPFAVKIFAPSFYQGGEKEIERFFQEARMLFKFNHPSIIKVYDAGLMNKRPFIRMEYFKGKNLNQILIDHGVINPIKALDMMEHLVDAIRHAHEDIGIIHRDLKPSNIMAAPPNQFRVIDFGLSIFIENDLHSRLTKTGEGTISGYYNAPELVKNPRLIDKRSDIYSLGAIWFTMLTGQPPAGTSLREQLDEVINVNQEYSNCISDCLTSLETRITDCNILLERIKKLKIK